jgi:hypothetical protein
VEPEQKHLLTRGRRRRWRRKPDEVKTDSSCVLHKSNQIKTLPCDFHRFSDPDRTGDGDKDRSLSPDRKRHATDEEEARAQQEDSSGNKEPGRTAGGTTDNNGYAGERKAARKTKQVGRLQTKGTNTRPKHEQDFGPTRSGRGGQNRQKKNGRHKSKPGTGNSKQNSKPNKSTVRTALKEGIFAVAFLNQTSDSQI